MDAPPNSQHPTDQTLGSFVQGKLDQATVVSVNTHLDECSGCCRRAAEIASNSSLGRLTEDQGATDNLKDIPTRVGGAQTMRGSGGSTLDPPSSKLPIGLEDHPDYEIKKELGRGGMGVVYLAHNRLMGRDEVLKVMGEHIMERPGVLDRFLNEIRAVARLRHPNIVAAYSAFRLGDRVVFAMEYVEGLDLFETVKSRGPLPVADACLFVYQTAMGLQHAHEAGMVHRDIKPANLMLSGIGNKAIVKILDFGLAKATSEAQVEHHLTQQGQMLGSPDFMAPEQWLNARKADIRADIYSLGCTLYYLLSGGPPFQGESLYDVFQAHHSMDAPLVSISRPEVPLELAALVAKMMAKAPDQRFQTPRDVADALESFFKTRSVASQTTPTEDSQTGTPATKPLKVDSVPPQPVPLLTEPEGNPRFEAKRESLIDFRDTKPEPTEARERRWPRAKWSIAIAASLFGVIVLGGIIITIKTKKGETQITVPDDASIVIKRDDKVVASDMPIVVGPAANHNPIPDVSKTMTPSPAPVSPSSPAPGIPPPPLPDQKINTNTIGMKLALIAAGTFQMGSPETDEEALEKEKPQHPVRISKAFYLGIHEVTQEEYEKVTGSNPSHFSANGEGKQKVAGRDTSRLPVENVSWHDAMLYCNALSDKEGLTRFYKNDEGTLSVYDWNRNGYRLPTEAEWEYACRAGKPTRYSFGDNPGSLGEFAWFGGNSDSQTHPVGEKTANSFGLHDMHGNVWEWCWDGYANYGQSPPTVDPRGYDRGVGKVIRGGCWGNDFRSCRSASRLDDWGRQGHGHLGFRVARNQSSR